MGWRKPPPPDPAPPTVLAARLVDHDVVLVEVPDVDPPPPTPLGDVVLVYPRMTRTTSELVVALEHLAGLRRRVADLPGEEEEALLAFDLARSQQLRQDAADLPVLVAQARGEVLRLYEEIRMADAERIDAEAASIRAERDRREKRLELEREELFRLAMACADAAGVRTQARTEAGAARAVRAELARPQPRRRRANWTVT